MKVRLVTDSLKEGYIHEIKAEGVRSANNFGLLHNFGYYTLNRIPDGERLVITENNKVNEPVMHHTMETDMKAPANAASVAKKGTAVKHLTKQPADWKNGPDRTLTIATKPGLKFDLETITVKAGAKMKVTLSNNDDMLHNLVFTTPGASNEVGELALKMGLDGQKLNYVPASSKVLYHTFLLQPG